MIPPVFCSKQFAGTLNDALTVTFPAIWIMPGLVEQAVTAAAMVL